MNFSCRIKNETSNKSALWLKLFFKLSFLCALLIACFSCSGKPPELMAIDWHLIRNADNAEVLSLFAASRDADGLSDLSELWLINDEAELSWKLTSDTWKAREANSETWIGSNAFSALGSFISTEGSSTIKPTPFIRGTYRVVLIDKAGERAEKMVNVQTIPVIPPAPLVVIQGTNITISGVWKEFAIAFLDRSGAVIKALRAEPKTYQIVELFGSNDYANVVFSIQAYGYDDANHVGAYSRSLELLR